MIVLDTNVVSELMRPAPSPAVKEWLRGRGEDLMVTTVITVSEIEYGLARLPPGRRRDQLEERFAALTGPDSDFSILPLDEAAARLAGRLRGDRESKGLPTQSADMMIAGIARLADAALATRNTKDFSETGIAVLNPWEG